jgi:hypothetical protein
VKARAPKGYFNDSPIRKAAEVVKYCFKPSEFDLLNDDQLAAFYNACKGLRFYTPLSNLREFRGQLKESRLKLKHIETDKGPAWRLVKGRTRGRLEDIEEDKQEQIDGSASSTVNVICGITAPSPTFSEVYEPSVIIRNFDGNLEGLLALNPWIEQRIAAVKKTVARQQEHQRQIEYRRARDRRASPAPSIWDTTTITVQNPVGEMIDSWFAPPEIPDDMGEAAWA